jgi:hypothetical protein
MIHNGNTNAAQHSVRRIFLIIKLKPSLDGSDFRGFHTKVVPPLRVRPTWQEEDHSVSQSPRRLVKRGKINASTKKSDF